MSALTRLLTRLALTTPGEAQAMLDDLDREPDPSIVALRRKIDDEIDKLRARIVCDGTVNDERDVGHGLIVGLKLARELTGEAWKPWGENPSWHRYADWNRFLGSWVMRETPLEAEPEPEPEPSKQELNAALAFLAAVPRVDLQSFAEFQCDDAGGGHAFVCREQFPRDQSKWCPACRVAVWAKQWLNKNDKGLPGSLSFWVHQWAKRDDQELPLRQLICRNCGPLAEINDDGCCVTCGEACTNPGE